MHLRLPILLIMLTTAFCLGGLYTATAQSKERPIDKDSPSWVLKQKKNNDAKKDFPKQEYPRYIVITETKGVLYGNPCALQETHKMGFEYVLLKEGQPGYETRWKKMTNNFFVKTGLVFRRSPFWKLILKNRIEDCRVNTGDFVGEATVLEFSHIEPVGS
jgi:hypothetical protein